MISKKYISSIIILLVIIISLITLIVGYYYFDWFKIKNNNYLTVLSKKIDIGEKEKKDIISDSTNDKIVSEKMLVNVENKNIGNIDKNFEKSKKGISDKDNDIKIILENMKKDKTVYEQKGDKSNFQDKVTKKDDKTISRENKEPILYPENQSFHSYGEYISEDEHKYRLSLINNLKIKSVVINSVSKGNGISQEFYKIAFNEKMIPAKVLEDIVESKEFRSLIPKNLLAIENKISQFKNGEEVIFRNSDIKQLLLLWARGKLTPIQKAWKVKANILFYLPILLEF